MEIKKLHMAHGSLYIQHVCRGYLKMNYNLFWNLWPLLRWNAPTLSLALCQFFSCSLATQPILCCCSMKSFNSIALYPQFQWFSGVSIFINEQKKTTLELSTERTEKKSSALTQLIEQNGSVFVIVHCLKSILRTVLHIICIAESCCEWVAARG